MLFTWESECGFLRHSATDPTHFGSSRCLLACLLPSPPKPGFNLWVCLLHASFSNNTKSETIRMKEQFLPSSRARSAATLRTAHLPCTAHSPFAGRGRSWWGTQSTSRAFAFGRRGLQSQTGHAISSNAAQSIAIIISPLTNLLEGHREAIRVKYASKVI